jgi:hypothetical protein
MTQNDTKWGENVTHEAKEGKIELCSETCIHCYSDPLMASFFNSIHADIQDPLLWEAEVYGETITDGCKIGCRKLTTIKQIPLPEITIEQRVTIGIKAALKNYHESSFVEWAEKWLSGEDRTYAAAYAACAAANAANAANAAAYAAANAAAYAAANVAYAAADAANAVAYAAANAAYAAADAAADAGVDILAIIKEVL